MFTGIIEDVGTVLLGEPGILRVETRLDSIEAGDSVAVNGICLTVRSILRRGKLLLPAFNFSPETSALTTIRTLRPGSAVNMERAVRADGRLGGHLMTGHVEGTGRLLRRQRRGNSHIFTFSADGPLQKYIVPKGSIGVDGISLTVGAKGKGFFSVSVVPYTLEHTNLRDMVAGRRVNLEPDLLAKYAESALLASPQHRPVSEETLRRNGFMT